MDWTLQPFSRKSAATGQSFEAGERVMSFVYKDATGALQRLDLKQSEIATSALPENILGRWSHAVKTKEERSQAKQERLQSAEACFLSLFEDDSLDTLPQPEEDLKTESVPSEEAVLDKDKAILKQLLALILERKRILKPTGSLNAANTLDYTHVTSQKNYTIPLVSYSKQDLQRVTEGLQHILRA